VIEAWELCGTDPGTSDRLKLVECVHSAVNVGTSASRAFEVTKRVAWLLRNEGGSLFLKPSGDNIIDWNGVSYSISRMCADDHHLYKVIGDAGEGYSNFPSWQDNGIAFPEQCVPAIDPGPLNLSAALQLLKKRY
jgi:hypothetical protein